MCTVLKLYFAGLVKSYGNVISPYLKSITIMSVYFLSYVFESKIFNCLGISFKTRKTK